MRKEIRKLLLAASAALFLLSGCGASDNVPDLQPQSEQTIETSVYEESMESSSAVQTENREQESEENQAEYIFSLADIPNYSGQPYIEINDNVPCFSENDFTTEAFEEYSELDSMGRCGVAFANIGTELMPTEERGEIGEVKPTGWQTVKYDIVDGKYLYNRCHLLGFQLTGENANEKNLITGTRSMNVDGMLPFENMVADYVKETSNHVLYRVTPVFEGDNLVATGVIMEAQSVEDNGEGIQFHVFVYNAQPGISIDYATGDNALINTEVSEPETGLIESEEQKSEETQAEYVLNTNTKKFHIPSCSSADDIKAENRQDYSGDRENLIADGYSPCKRCNP